MQEIWLRNIFATIDFSATYCYNIKSNKERRNFPMTLRNLAKKAGVSVGTVSKAFSYSKEISNETRERIFAIAKQEGCYQKYRKDKYERYTIAIICQELKNAFYYQQIEFLQDILNEKNAEIIISIAGFDPKRQQELITYHSQYTKVDGILVFGLHCNVPNGIETPIVCIGDCIDKKIPRIDIHVREPLVEALLHLKEAGHHHITFIRDPYTSLLAAEYKKALAEAKIPLSEDFILFVSSRFAEGGKEGIDLLLKQKNPCTAIICADDDMAIGAIRRLQEKGYRVPEDYSVIGINNIPHSAHLTPALTTIDQAAFEVCDLACDLLFKKINNKHHYTSKSFSVSGQLILRETTGKSAN